MYVVCLKGRFPVIQMYLLVCEVMDQVEEAKTTYICMHQRQDKNIKRVIMHSHKRSNRGFIVL